MEKKVFTLCPQRPTELDLEFRRTLLLTGQVALLGEVSGAVRGVTLGWTSAQIVLRSVIDGPVDDRDHEAMECVGTEIIASFPEHHITVEVIRIDAPEDIRQQGLAAWIYMRKER